MQIHTNVEQSEQYEMYPVLHNLHSLPIQRINTVKFPIVMIQKYGRNTHRAPE